MKTLSAAVHARRRMRRMAALQVRFDAAGARIRRLADANVRLSETAAGLLRLLARAAEGGDLETAGHAERTSRLAVLLARRMGACRAVIEDVRTAALVHDLGRRGDDPGGAGHAERAVALLETLSLGEGVLEAVRCHHERWDGRGNRTRRAGDALPAAARILAVADAFDEMTAPADGEGLAAEDALAALQATAGRVHDPAVVAALAGIGLDDLRRLGAHGLQATGAFT